MARKIRFRAWDTLYKCYLYDIQNAYDTLSGGAKESDRENAENADCDEECFGAFLDKDSYSSNSRYTVQQYIGIKDINGNNIYEGDIIVTHPKNTNEASKVGVVTYGGPSASFLFKMRGGNTYNIWTSNRYRTYEVIGNISENEELLEETNE